jgi:hypothetical protein
MIWKPRAMLSVIGEGQRVARALNPATVMAALAILVFLYAIQRILLPFIFAGVVAYVCTPLVTRLTQSLRLPRTLLLLRFSQSSSQPRAPSHPEAQVRTLANLQCQRGVGIAAAAG